ncbi:MAG: radical SAM protein [Chlamydiota bacterium]
MKRILFLNPPISPEERYGELASAGAMEPPHGLTYLAAVMRAAGWEARILDAEALRMTPGHAAAAAVSLSPDVFACTAVTVSISRAAEVAASVKRSRPGTVTVLGGVHLTSQPRETMERFPCFDYGVIGEGERAVREFCEALDRGGAPGAVPGVVSREGGELRIAPPGPFLKNLDALPLPAWDLLPPLARTYALPPQSVMQSPSTSLITSRGCTGRCIFCDTSVFRNVCRAHSAEYVMTMIRTLARDYGIREILFEDDNFVLFRARLERLTELLRSAGTGVSWSCLARVDMMPQPATLRAMRAAGCWQMLVGIESGCQEILDLEKKGITLAQIAEAVRRARDCGMRTKGFLMVGHPTETPDTVARTIRFVNSLPLDDVSVTYFTVFPGSPMWPEASRWGAVSPDFDRMSVFHPTFIPHGFTEASLTEASRRILRCFYLRPRVVLAYLGRIRSPRQLAALARGAMALLKHLLFRRDASSPEK